MFHDLADDLLVDLARNQAQHLAPIFVAAVGVVQGEQLRFAQRPRVLEPCDVFRRR